MCWLSAWETLSEQAQFMNANEPKLTASFEPITSQDYNNRTLHFPSAHKSYIHPAEFLKRGVAQMFQTPGSRTERFSPLGRRQAVQQPKARPCCPPVAEPPPRRAGPAPARGATDPPAWAAFDSGTWGQIFIWKFSVQKKSNLGECSLLWLSYA